MMLAQRSLQSARLIHFALLFATVAYTAIPFLTGPPKVQPPSAILLFALGIVSLSSLTAGFFIRSRLVQPAREALRSNPDDSAAARRWRSGVIISLMFCETILLFGFALRFLGGSWNVCGAFYGVGIFFLLAWTPRLELPPN